MILFPLYSMPRANFFFSVAVVCNLVPGLLCVILFMSANRKPWFRHNSAQQTNTHALNKHRPLDYVALSNMKKYTFNIFLLLRQIILMSMVNEVFNLLLTFAAPEPPHPPPHPAPPRPTTLGGLSLTLVTWRAKLCACASACRFVCMARGLYTCHCVLTLLHKSESNEVPINPHDVSPCCHSVVTHKHLLTGLTVWTVLMQHYFQAISS